MTKLNLISVTVPSKTEKGKFENDVLAVEKKPSTEMAKAYAEKIGSKVCIQYIGTVTYFGEDKVTSNTYFSEENKSL